VFPACAATTRAHAHVPGVAAHLGGGWAGAVGERERYREQLERYAVALAVGPSKLGLYFPLLKGWREWESKD